MNTKESARIKTLLQNYKAGNCSPEEQARIETWLEQLNEQEQTGTADATDKQALQRIRRQVLNQIKADNKVRKLPLLRYLKIAALVLLMPTGWLIYSKLSKPAPQVLQQYFTHRGERKTLILTDSTVVVLNSSSVLTISNDFGKAKRSVTLAGEGYFHVKHDATRPFIVTTGNIQTQVLGTQFNIHAYANDNEYTVAVVGGRVRVSENSTANTMIPLGKVLTRNLMLAYDKKTHRYVTKTADADKLSAWQHGELYFDNASIPEIAATLSRMYNIDVQLMDKPGHNCRYTIDFNGQPLNKVLQVLGELTGITYHYNTNKIIINSKNCH
jgi:ferric-dicitrate binding protein FerR (iron transport regulator)